MCTLKQHKTEETSNTFHNWVCWGWCIMCQLVLINLSGKLMFQYSRVFKLHPQSSLTIFHWRTCLPQLPGFVNSIFHTCLIWGYYFSRVLLLICSASYIFKARISIRSVHWGVLYLSCYQHRYLWNLCHTKLKSQFNKYDIWHLYCINPECKRCYLLENSKLHFVVIILLESKLLRMMNFLKSSNMLSVFTFNRASL